MIVPVVSRRDIEACVDLYLPHDTWIKGDRNKSLQTLSIASKRNTYLRAFKEGEDIIAFLYAEIVQPSHLSFFCLRQEYFCSVGGRKGVRGLFALHDDLVQYAEGLKIPLVLSSGSHLDEDNKFSKLLEKHGWERRGYMAAFKTSHFKQ